MQVMQLTPAPLRVLVVEDHADGRESLCQLLTLLGHDVTATADGEAGLSVGLEMRPDVAIIDINLPQMDGRQVAELLRRALSEAVTLIAYSGDTAIAEDRSAPGPAFNEWMAKPAELPELLSSLNCLGMK